MSQNFSRGSRYYSDSLVSIKTFQGRRKMILFPPHSACKLSFKDGRICDCLSTQPSSYKITTGNESGGGRVRVAYFSMYVCSIVAVSGCIFCKKCLRNISLKRINF